MRPRPVQPRRVLLSADDDTREHLLSLLDEVPHWTVAAEAQPGLHTLGTYRAAQADVLLMALPDPMRLVAELSLVRSASCVVVLARPQEDRAEIEAAVGGGAGGVLGRGTDARGLAETLDLAVDLQPMLASALHRSMLATLREQVCPASGATSASERGAAQVRRLLTPRQHEILDLVARGHSHRQIGDRLFIGEPKAREYVHTLAQTLAVGSRTALLLRAARFGLLDPTVLA